jgi:hypothetical protein
MRSRPSSTRPSEVDPSTSITASSGSATPTHPSSIPGSRPRTGQLPRRHRRLPCPVSGQARSPGTSLRASALAQPRLRPRTWANSANLGLRLSPLNPCVLLNHDFIAPQPQVSEDLDSASPGVMSRFPLHGQLWWPTPAESRQLRSPQASSAFPLSLSLARTPPVQPPTLSRFCPSRPDPSLSPPLSGSVHLRFRSNPGRSFSVPANSGPLRLFSVPSPARSLVPPAP